MVIARPCFGRSGWLLSNLLLDIFLVDIASLPWGGIDCRQTKQPSQNMGIYMRLNNFSYCVYLHEASKHLRVVLN